ncbi:hypothetical protein BC629DRAFT_1436591 [Irpex lacteus]|nr:hypothetical protein BC629DRAFT_1436591 [Irpex lacteus]
MHAFRRAWVAFSLVITLAGPGVIWDFRVAAQTTTAMCKPGYEWMFNSLRQSPCLIASYLGAGCSDPSSCNIAPTFSNYYHSKASATDCTCNSVAYSVFSACVLCQTQLPTYLPWSLWIKNCTRTYVDEYPMSVPKGTAIPEWAFHNVTDIDNFNATIAKAVAARDSDLAETEPSLITASASPSPPLSTSPSAPTPSVTVVINPDSNNVRNPLSFSGTIAGVVTGGVLLLVAIVGGTAKWRKHRRSATQTQPTSTTNLNAQLEPDASPQLASMHETGSILPLTSGAEVTHSTGLPPVASGSRLYVRLLDSHESRMNG